MQQDIKPAESWYEATVSRENYAPLAGVAEADVCVIGAGFAGLVTALECQRRGLATVLLDASRVACGASGRNGGFVSNGFALGVEGIMRVAGRDSARALYQLSREGTNYVREMLRTHEPSAIMGQGGRVALRHRDDGSLKAYAELMNRDHGEKLHYSTTEETRLHLVSPRYFESITSDNTFHIHTLSYGLLLARLAAAAGVRVHENAAAISVTKSAGGSIVKTAAGEVRARHVVHCVSSLAPHLHRTSGRAILPVATYVAVTNPLQQDVIRTSAAIADTRRAGDYYRLITGGRLLWGGRITTRVSEPAQLAEVMRRDMVSVYPSLADARIDYAWAGLMGYAIHKMPLIGRDADGQWYATAFGGHGLNTTAMGGLLIARGIAGEDDAWRQFAPFAPRWAFGQLGRLGVQGSYWWMQAQDRWEEKKSSRG